MKISSTTFALVMGLTAVLSVGCSSKDDPKKAVTGAAGGTGGGAGASEEIQGTWTVKSHFESWQEFEAGTKTADQACSVFKEKDPHGYDAIYKGSISWLDGNQAKTCEWVSDWKSNCEVEGTVSGMTATVQSDGITGEVYFEVVDGVLDMSGATVAGKKMTKEELIAQGGSSDALVRISEEQIPGMHKFITETCKL